MTATAGAEDRRELRRVAAALGLLLVLATVAVGALLAYSVAAIDKARAVAEAELIERSLQRTRQRLVEDVTSVSIWDDTYRLFGDSPDWAWVQINFGDYFADYMKHDVTLAFDRRGRYVYASRASERVPTSDEAALARAAASLVAAVRAEGAAKRFAPDGVRRFGFDAVATRTEVVRPAGGEPYLLVASTVVTETAGAIDSGAPDAVVVTGRRLGAVADTLAADLALKDLRTVATGSPARILVKNDAGEPAVGLDWTPGRPGFRAVSSAGPAVLAGLILLAGAGGLLLWRVLAVTARLEARRLELVEAMAALTRARDAAEAAAASKSRFLANMSHELRTPLNGVIALGELLHGRQVEPESREMAGLIVSSGRVLQQVVDDVLDVAKIEAGRVSLEQRPFDLPEVLRGVCELHAAAAAAKGVVLRWSAADDVERAWVGDATRLSQILSNLLSNAVKFTEAGSVAVRATRTRSGFAVTVRDTGVGFDRAAGERLFRAFEQADDSVTRRFGGTGLGLSIVRSLVELHGGRVQARSAPGRGSVFRVDLPLAPCDHAASAAQDGPELAGDAIRTGLRILLAEDHPTNQKVIALVLAAVEAELTIVETGAAAVEAFRGGAFDLVLMDVQMPEMDGLTATRLIRAWENEQGRAPTPVVSLTAHAMDEHRSASREAGADLHLPKPIRPEQLLQTVAALTGETREASPEQALAAA